MSSVSVKRSYFLRSSSIEKLKCTASLMYPLQFAGIKLTKESQKYFSGKSIIIRSRTQLYRSYLATSNGLSEILYMMLMWVLDILAKSSVINKSVAAEISYKYKLKHKKFIIRKRKEENYVNVKKDNFISNEFDNIQILLNKIQKENDCINKVNDDFELNKFFKDDDEDYMEILRRNRIRNEQKFYSILSKTQTGDEFEENKNQILLRQLKYSSCNSNQNLKSLKFCLYLCVTLIYIKLHLLCSMLFASNPPIGLIFLISNLCIIGGILIQIFCTSAKNNNSNQNTVQRLIVPEK